MQIRTIRLADLYKIKIKDKKWKQVMEEIQTTIKDRVDKKISNYIALCSIPNIMSLFIEHSIK